MWLLTHRLECTLSEPNHLALYLDIDSVTGDPDSYLTNELPEGRRKVVSIAGSETEEERDAADAAEDARNASANRSHVSAHSRASANVSIDVTSEMGNAPSPGHPLAGETDVKHPSDDWEVDPSSAGGIAFEPAQNSPRTGISPIPTPGSGRILVTTPTPRSGQNSPRFATAPIGTGPITLITPAGGLGQSSSLNHHAPVGPPPPRN